MSKLPITACVWDTGFFVPLAEKLGEQYERVLYYCPRESGYMRSNDDRVGEGIDNVEKIISVWDKLDQIDLFVFPDCYFSSEQTYLRSIGKRVWGSAETSWMEQDRFRMRKWQKSIGLPTPSTEKCVGIDELKDVLFEDQFIKINRYRADMETARHYDKTRSEHRFDDMKVKFGAYKNMVPFLIEDKIEGIEVGFDGFSVDGQFPKSCIFGMEVKDRGYLGKSIQYQNLPESVRKVNEAISEVFFDEQMRSFYSNEIRIDKKKRGFLIDSTMRCGNPPYQLFLEMWSNIGEIIYKGSNGEMVEPKSIAKYGAIAIITSEFAVNNWLSIKVPQEIRKFVKLSNSTQVDGELYTVPIYHLAEVGAVVGLGNTAKEAISECKKHADVVEGDSIEVDVDSLEQALDKLSDSKQYGVEF